MSSRCVSSGVVDELALDELLDELVLESQNCKF